jgi:ABC-type nitrate/sulfonate/bicarbonate transport system substrate-binding protein
MDHVNFPYRSSSHLNLLHVVHESGSWARHGLEVDYNKEIDRDDAHRMVSSGEIEFASGNHVSTYAARARGDNWVYLGQTISQNHLSLITRQDTGINKLEDIRHRKFASKGRHSMLNDWLYLKQHGFDIDKDDVDFVKYGSAALDPALRNMGKVDAVAAGNADACFVSQPAREFAERRGLKAIDIEVQPMILFSTLSTSLPFVQKHPDIVTRMLKGMLEGIAFFKTEREKTIDILMKHQNEDGAMDQIAATKVYEEIAGSLEPKLYPSMAAIFNVYEEAKRQSKESEKVHPLALWDFHPLREIDDSGFIDALYKGKTIPAGTAR